MLDSTQLSLLENIAIQGNYSAWIAQRILYSYSGQLNENYLSCDFYETESESEYFPPIEPFNNNEPSLIIYPNPATNILNVQINSSDGEANSIIIVDRNGREIYRKANVEEKMHLDIASFAPGIYFIVVDGANHLTGKFVKI